MTSTPQPATEPEALSYGMLLGDPDRHREGLLGLAGLEASRGRFVEALRLADRARRLEPAAAVLAILCARLNLRLGEPDNAWRALGAAAPGDDPALLGLARAEVRLAQGEIDAAAVEVEALLLAFAADGPGGLPDLADAVCRAGRPAGWVGLSADGAVIGALGPSLDRVRAALEGPARQALAARLPRGVLGARVLDSAPSWRLDMRLRRRPGALQGSATLGWSPDTPLTVIATDARGVTSTVRTTPRPGVDGSTRQVFTLPLDEAGYAGPIRLEVVTPDGARHTFPDARPPTAPTQRRAPQKIDPSNAPPLAVVVPVYGGREDTVTCLRSVLATTDGTRTELIVVDDASPNADLKRDLADLAAAGRITLLVNPENRGFPYSANRGMALRPDRDVVLLNADAEVFPGGLDRLRRAAHAAPDIGTATPFSNNGSMMAYPAGQEIEVGAALGGDLDARLARLNPGRRLDLPSGAGFCLYIRRDCLDAVGDLDEAAFGRGYGEENDFCLRASALGWRHVGAADVFVRHGGGRSFGALKPLLIDHGLKVLYRRHPTYRRVIRRFLKTDPARLLRQALDEDRLVSAPRPSALLITLGRGGGVASHVERRVRALQAEGLRVIELRPDREEAAGGRCRLLVAGESLLDLVFDLPSDLDGLTQLLAAAGVSRVEIHHSLGLDPAVLDLPARLGASFDVYVHDYSWICPRITLMAAEPRYCGEPDLAGCEACLARNGPLIEETLSVAELRVRSARLMRAARQVIAPTADSARRIARHAPDARLVVSPWEPYPDTPAAPRRRLAGAPIRVAVVGAIGQHKGYDRILACARDAAARDLPLEFVVIGYTEDDPPLFETGKTFVTGPFEDSEIDALLRREACDVGLLPSVWPETWCYALTHLLRSGLPLLAFDLGAMAERLSGVPRARLLPLDIEAPALNDALLAAARLRTVMNLKTRTAGLSADRPWIEAMRVDLAGVGPAGELAVGAIMAGEVPTPWAAGPDWARDPDGARPLTAFSVRLGGELAKVANCRYRGAFSSGWSVDAAAGEWCRSPMANDTLVSAEVTLDLIDG